jgi:cholesterol oxidase
MQRADDEVTCHAAGSASRRESGPEAADTPGPGDQALDHDVVVVGSGFGGSVAALRLAEKGYRVLVLEAGRRFADSDFPRTSWNLRRYLWAPRLGCFGLQRIHLLGHVLVLAGAGVGGGSLVYGNTLYEPPAAFFTDPQWADITDWADELAPYYAVAQRMLGVVAADACEGPVEQVMRQTARAMGVEDTFRKTPVGVFFGRDGTLEPGVRVPDPFFGGAGPDRTGCTECGNCLVGCRVGAKNTLVKNYLALAERLGAQVAPLRTVVDVRPLDPGDPGGGWQVTTTRTGAWWRRDQQVLTCRDVVLAAGTWGTQSLLHAMKAGGHTSGKAPWHTRTGDVSVRDSTWAVVAALVASLLGYGPNGMIMMLVSVVLTVTVVVAFVAARPAGRRILPAAPTAPARRSTPTEPLVPTPTGQRWHPQWANWMGAVDGGTP